MTDPFQGRMERALRTRASIRDWYAKPWDAYAPRPWRDITANEAAELAGKTVAIVEYDEDAQCLLVFEDGVAVQFLGLSAQSNDCLVVAVWEPSKERQDRP